LWQHRQGHPSHAYQERQKEMKLFEQIEKHCWGRDSKWKRWVKKAKARLERREAKKNPDHVPTYKKYKGYEY